ncbi:MAG: Crp/Fnr family transcriptional regulator [Pyrinomonadaceae bacterium]|nr:Crp/Fnr family transcriptional regulator [Pyrinomonadaceae bacterium]
MPKAVRPPPQNKILAALPGKEYDRLLPHLTLVSLQSGDTLYETKDRIKYVYFVNRAVVSLVTHIEDGTSVEVGLVGNEGMVGLSVVMGDDVSQTHAIVQMADGALRMETGKLWAELKRGGQLQSLLLRYSLVLLKQVSQTAACNRNHNLGERLARWLLLCHDRVGGDEIRLTQEFLAQMLGTRRSRVSEAAIILQTAGLIHYSRGIITILEREGLEEFTCECYQVVRAELDRLHSKRNRTNP